LTSIVPSSAAASRYWVAAQYLGVGLTIVLLIGLALRPTESLHILWDMVIPLLPAVFLVNPMLWRTVCPLATLNSLSGKRVGKRILDSPLARVSWIVGIVLLGVLVPARRFLFNTNGIALGVTIAAVAVLAIASGFVFSRRGGFCNAICPVLPVEKLYGQAPLVRVSNPRCADCSLCTPVGCIDLAGVKTVAQTIGPVRRDHRWLLTPFGMFAAAFPGFVFSFFAVDNGPFATALTVYGTVLWYSIWSYVTVAGIAFVTNARSTTLTPLLGATALGLYYWLSAPTLAAAYGFPRMGPPAVRIAAGMLLVFWLASAWPSRRMVTTRRRNFS
jgi:hypothetical protein